MYYLEEEEKGKNHQFCISLKLKFFQHRLHSHIMHIMLNNIAKLGVTVSLLFIIIFIFCYFYYLFGSSHYHLYINFGIKKREGTYSIKFAVEKILNQSI